MVKSKFVICASESRIKACVSVLVWIIVKMKKALKMSTKAFRNYGQSSNYMVSTNIIKFLSSNLWSTNKDTDSGHWHGHVDTDKILRKWHNSM